MLEDDPYGLVRYDDEPVPSMFELADGEQIAYCSSFSKTVAPGLRVGWFVLPAELAAEIEALAVSTYISPPYLSPGDGARVHGARHLRPESRACERPPAGASRRHARRSCGLHAGGRELHTSRRRLLRLGRAPVGSPAAELLVEAEKAGVTFVKGTDFYAGGAGGEQALRLAFSFVSPDEIAEGVSLLGSLVRAATPAAL